MKRFASFALILAGCGSGFATASHGGGDGGENDAGTGGHVSAVRGATDAMAVVVGSSGGIGGASSGGGGETPATGGAVGTGGGGSGGLSGSGGAGSGGVPATGGLSGTGGVLGTGGLSGAGGSLVGAGGASTSDGGPVCLTDLSGVGTGDFRIAFTLKTTAQAYVNLLAQQVDCTPPSIVWSVWLTPGGQIAAGTGDTQHWVIITEANSVTDGRSHAIVFARTSGKIWISRDGVVDSIPADDPHSIGVLPPLQIGTETGDCSGLGLVSAQKAGAVISGVCISEK